MFVSCIGNITVDLNHSRLEIICFVCILYRQTLFYFSKQWSTAAARGFSAQARGTSHWEFIPVMIGFRKPRTFSHYCGKRLQKVVWTCDQECYSVPMVPIVEMNSQLNPEIIIGLKYYLNIKETPIKVTVAWNFIQFRVDLTEFWLFICDE